MARINTNVGALIAQRYLTNSFKSLNSTLERLSTGLRINHGRDDPGGLIVSERLRSEVSAIGQAVANTQRAGLIVATSEGALDEISALLRDIQGLIISAANAGALSDEEIAANQLQVDSAVASITRIANAATFAGRALLNGSLDYLTSGVAATDIRTLAIHGAQFGTRDFIPVTVDVTQSAQFAQLEFRQATLASAATIEILGNRGVTTLSFSSGTTASAIVAAINAVSDATGVLATLSSNPLSGFRLTSGDLGSKHFVSVQTLPGSGAFPLVDETGATRTRDHGRDAVATINGTSSIGQGNHLVLKTASLDMELVLANTFGTGTTSFAIIGGGALFQIGAHVNSTLQVNLGVQSTTASRLGNSDVGFLSQIVTGERYSLVAGKYLEASEIVTEAIRQVAVLRGRLGAFEKNTLETMQNHLAITVESLTSAESAIRDADFAMETSQLTRNQVLVNSGMAALAAANQTPQLILRLLTG